jgi:chromosome segregation ATPase
MTIAVIPRESAAELKATARAAAAELAKLERELAGLPQVIAAAIAANDPKDPMAVERLRERAAKLPREIQTAKAQAEKLHQDWCDAREAERKATIARTLDKARELQRERLQRVYLMLRSLGEECGSYRRGLLEIADLVVQLMGDPDRGRAEVSNDTTSRIVGIFADALETWLRVGVENDSSFKVIDVISGLDGDTLRMARESFLKGGK